MPSRSSARTSSRIRVPRLRPRKRSPSRRPRAVSRPPCSVARLDDPAGLAAALRDVRVVLHAAGPFSLTARPMLDACLEAGVHYLDLSAGIDEIEAAVARDAEARRRRIMVMPAVGFDVVPS